VLGDVAAHRIGQALRQARAWRRDTTARTAQTFKEYVNEEQSMVVPRAAAEAFARDVERLREALEALERRVGKL
jgi:ubiquinone biosynthesis accessory factor UbiJ